MSLENLTIERVCLHEVYRRNDDRNIASPTYGDELLELDARALDVFTSRVLSAFRTDAKCMQMAIESYGTESIAALGAELVNSNDKEFVDRSKAFADLLAGAQTSRAYPGGLVIVFTGTVGYPAKSFFAVMKAELHEAFIKSPDLKATFVDSVFLGPKTKLYKIGLFIAADQPPAPLPLGWTATVYDSQLTATQRDGAALYFHERFLGLRIPDNSAQQTKNFYQNTRDFIAIAPVDEEKRVGLYDSLHTYLKLDRSPTIQVGTFAEIFMDEDLGDKYRRHMRRKNFPDHAIQKDLTEIAGRLRTRKFRFGGRITLAGPADAIANLVSVEAITDEKGNHQTRLTIQGEIESQE
ncbi:nucleoid-associated protein [Komagataeibacter sp. FNDCF1]|uniref:nucleoid-associated protein n=1 Tax=Komagataeibacter sp. FNDCF1 TaxID=2878681 RepID=UPI001E46F5BB|nr:nucleoid-associated protein [Komagataeibacter sp. FNDCF1]MCE2563802.1 nucleoid-associated protein [Komagataeibacter sp. FNDCF1]